MSTNVMPITVLAVWAALFTVASTSLLHDKRIVNGVEAEPLSHPYMVSLQSKCEIDTEHPNCQKGNKWDHFCGGVVIDGNWVLTAAHCVQWRNKNSMRLKFGEHNLKEVTSFEFSRNVQTIIIHYGWNNKDISNDIALIRLDTPVELGGNVQAAKLSQDDSVFVNKTCVLAGWGRTEEGVWSNVLREVNTTHIPNDLCVYMYREIKPWNKENLDELRARFESKLCAFDLYPGPQGPGDSCDRDSGGPMLCGENHKTLIGITSFGFDRYGGNKCGWLGVYTRVSKYLTWIRKTIANVDSV